MGRERLPDPKTRTTDRERAQQTTSEGIGHYSDYIAVPDPSGSTPLSAYQFPGKGPGEERM